MSEFTVDQGRAEDLINRCLTAALNDWLEDEDALDLGIDAAASLERAVAPGLEDDEPDTGLYEASLTRLTGLAGSRPSSLVRGWSSASAAGAST
jgi:hypothetical protein